MHESLLDQLLRELDDAARADERPAADSVSGDHVRADVADESGLLPIRWQELDRQVAGRTWTLLLGWVTWLVERYGLTEVLPCWYRHGAMVEELSALWVAWRAAYDPEAMAVDPLFWHDHLDRTRVRLQQWARDSACRTAGEHRSPRPVRLPDRTDLGSFLSEDLMDRSGHFDDSGAHSIQVNSSTS
jgi:hypothetical protein